MTDQSSSQGWPDDWNRGEGGAAGAARPAPGGAGQPTVPVWQAGAQQGYQQPGYQQPGYQQPGAQQPGPQQPGYQQPGPRQPGAQQPGPQQPGLRQQEYAQEEYEQGYEQQGHQQPGLEGRPQPARQDAGAKGFVSALFDFSFSSFVTTRIIKVLYALILVLVLLSALIFTIAAFRLNITFGLLTLVIGDPLFVLIVMAFWRLVLETFIVVFRIAEDIRTLRDR